MKNIRNLIGVLQQHYHFEFKWRALYIRNCKFPNEHKKRTATEAQLEMQFTRLHN